jgi:hypothetical protein
LQLLDRRLRRRTMIRYIGNLADLRLIRQGKSNNGPLAEAVDLTPRQRTD